MEVITKNDVLTAYSAEDLAKVMGVSVRTAQRYQSAESTPPQGLIDHVWNVYRGRIMPESWPDRLRFSGNQIQSSETTRPLNWATIEQLDWIMGQWYSTLDYLGKMNKVMRQSGVDLSSLEPAVNDEPKKPWPRVRQPNFHRKHGC